MNENDKHTLNQLKPFKCTKPNERIVDLRVKLRLSESDVAKRIGLSVTEYEDIESHSDELYMVVPIGKVKRLCEVLGTDIVTLYQFGSCSERPENDYLLLKRQQAGLSMEQLSDLVGIEKHALLDAERDLSTLKAWVMDAVIDLAKALKVSPACLVAKI
jgi:transcriptional regulator with XRE-family HTH domain